MLLFKLLKFKLYEYNNFLKINFIILIIYLVIIIFDLFLLDDEPLWEPLEWSLIQTWLLYIYLFSWISENIQSSNLGSYSSRDKKVYTGLFKSWWFVEFWFCFNIIIACIFIATPFYFETNYYLSNLNTWWNWFNKFFFLKLSHILMYSIYLSYFLLILNKWYNWKIKFIISFIIILFISYFIFFIIFNFLFFYSTDYFRFKRLNWLNYFTISKGPNRWNYGVDSKYDKDKFNYHKTPWKFWFKNDSLYSSIFIIINWFILLSFFFLYIKWVVFLKYIFINKKTSFTFVNFIYSNFFNFFIFYFFLFVFCVLSLYYQFLRYASGLFYFNKINFIKNIILFY